MRDIYRDMAERTGGDIYIAVAGPVRTGKSTFIKRFSELLLLPNMENEYEKERLTDELPQSGAGRSIMTTQPRFVPAEAVNVTFEEGVSCRCKLIDCVGYMVPGAVGDREGDALEKEMATHSSVLAWRISGTAEPGGLPSLGSHRVGHD